MRGGSEKNTKNLTFALKYYIFATNYCYQKNYRGRRKVEL